MCAVSACENMQKRVSHGETVRVGSSVINTEIITVVHPKYTPDFIRHNKPNVPLTSTAC